MKRATVTKIKTTEISKMSRHADRYLAGLYNQGLPLTAITLMMVEYLKNHTI